MPSEVPGAAAAVTLMENAALVCPGCTVTDAGLVTVTPVAPIPIETLSPELPAGLLSVTVHEAVPGAVNELGEQTRAFTVMVGTHVPIETGMALAFGNAPRALVS